ncbi:hypothetical protein EUGRSUZ_L02938 [Eucalyptus grandis]|uniref:Uncharacterized protein n=1 Tax=Eucalyptus grandis TaxID=71139 RepID=A0AAD9T8C5_EUCGR|nr:hypothetical protein EUGRSUZ_L02938 [Eucalyptus grandis]
MASYRSSTMLQPARHEEDGGGGGGGGGGDGSITRRLKWWQRALYLQEDKRQVLFSMPMILTSLSSKTLDSYPDTARTKQYANSPNATKYAFL